MIVAEAGATAFLAISFIVCFTLFKEKKSNVINTYP
jgi:hypothetical protein